ncbi:MAG: class I SAM-dependent methyltransferase [Granulosicoccus sp.]|nr:class I SAM-dependent methyltransferase [Granulosicoccus sp.]
MVDRTDTEHREGFSHSWLSLREPVDHAARNRTLDTRLRNWALATRSLCILEFGAGTGSNLRYLCPKLGHDQHWTLLDNDPSLLSHLPGLVKDWAAENDFDSEQQAGSLRVSGEHFSASIQWQRIDLASELACLPFASADLVTGSALLDLTSEAWLRRLALLCLDNRCASYFVLNYDGNIVWHPENGDDAMLRQLLNEHQLGDKGFGPALGPQAGEFFASQLYARQTVEIAASPWHLDAGHRDLQTALIEGWSTAATELAATSCTRIERWQRQRQRYLSLGQSRLRVGHQDILALPR